MKTGIEPFRKEIGISEKYICQVSQSGSGCQGVVNDLDPLIRRDPYPALRHKVDDNDVGYYLLGSDNAYGISFLITGRFHQWLPTAKVGIHYICEVARRCARKKSTKKLLYFCSLAQRSSGGKRLARSFTYKKTTDACEGCERSRLRSPHHTSPATRPFNSATHRVSVGLPTYSHATDGGGFSYQYYLKRYELSRFIGNFSSRKYQYRECELLYRRLQCCDANQNLANCNAR